jgi:hypothetical protein
MGRIFERVVRWMPIGVCIALITAYPTPLGVFAAVLLLIPSEVLKQRLLQFLRESGWLTPGSQSVYQWRAGKIRLANHPTTKDRVIGWGEIAMGGPEWSDWLLADGAVLHGIAHGPWHIGSRYCAGLDDPRNNERFLIYDQQEHVVYRGESGEIARRLEILGARALKSSTKDSHTGWAARLLTEAEAHRMLHVRGLWVVAGGDFVPPPNTLQRELKNGGVLEARLLLPDDLRPLDDPYDLLLHAPYDLFLNGNRTGLRVLALDDVFEADSLVVVRGVLVGEALDVSNGVWHLIHLDGRCQSMLSYVTRVKSGGGYYRPYFISPKEIRSDGHVVFEFDDRFDLDAESDSHDLPPDLGSLPVSWQDDALLLPVDHLCITVKPP